MQQFTHCRWAWTLLMFCLLLSAKSLEAQDLDSLLNMSAFTEESELQRMLNKNVNVSSSKALSSRETPGIVSIITAEDIQNIGARDLTDVLRLIPGFDILHDVNFTLGLGVRGNWANEGKVLFLLDGHAMNELLYQTVAIGNRFPVDAIARIEVIRGPGSAIYGGSAEYGVINIITKAADSLHGIHAYGVTGLHSNAIGRSNAGFMIGHNKNNTAIYLSLFGGKSIISDQQYLDLFEEFETFDLSKNTYADPLNVNLGLRHRGINFRAMYDQFKSSEPTVYVSNKNLFFNLDYLWNVNEKLTVKPQLKYYNQVPWEYGDREENAPDFRVRAERRSAQVDAFYQFSRKVNLSFGSIYFHDRGTDLLDDENFDGENVFDLYNYALYTEGLFKHRLVNTTLGFRFEKNNLYGAAFVPRIALTRKIENFHFKALFSQAFRAPSIQNLNLSLDGEEVRPEKSNVFEFELGYQFTPEMLLSANVFHITTRDVIIYGSDVSGDDFFEWYENFSKSGTKGIEAIYNYRKSKWSANLSYSYSQAISGNTVTSYMLPNNSRQFVGQFAHKATFNGNYALSKHINLNTSLIYGGKRFAFTELDADDEPMATPISDYLLMNVFLNYRNLLPGLHLGAGVYDLLDQRVPYLQAYNGGFAPIPGRSREFILKISYQLNFNQ